MSANTTDPNLAALTLVYDFEVMSVHNDDLGTNKARSHDRRLRNQKKEQKKGNKIDRDSDSP